MADIGDLPFQPIGSTINRLLNEKLGDIVSVKDFGAVGDGTTDDTQAFQDTFDFATGSTGYGNLVYIPEGRYLVGELNFGTNNPTSENNAPSGIVGAGIRASVLVSKSGTTTLLKATNLSLRIFRDFWIQGNDDMEVGMDAGWWSGGPSLGNEFHNIRISGYSQTGLIATNQNDSTFKNLMIVSPTTDGLTAIDCGGTGGLLTFQECKTFNGYIDTGAQNVDFISCVTQGIRIKYGSFNLINFIGGYHYTNSDNDCTIEIQSPNVSKGFTFTGCLFDFPSTAGTLIGGNGGLMTGAQFETCFFYSASNTANNVRMIGANVTCPHFGSYMGNLTFEQCNFGNGIAVYNFTSPTSSGNPIFNINRVNCVDTGYEVPTSARWGNEYNTQITQKQVKVGQYQSNTVLSGTNVENSVITTATIDQWENSVTITRGTGLIVVKTDANQGPSAIFNFSKQQSGLTGAVSTISSVAGLAGSPYAGTTIECRFNNDVLQFRAHGGSNGFGCVIGLLYV